MSELNENYLSNIDKNKMASLMSETETNVAYFDEIINGTVSTYTAKLDEIMTEVYDDLVEQTDIPVEIIERHFIKLTNVVYFIGSTMESLGIRDDISEAMYKEVYNKEYLNQQNIERDKKLTQATLQALAENKGLYENTLNMIYQRAYKIMKFKIESANEMIRTLSKVMSRRMQENQLVVNADKRIDSLVAQQDTKQVLYE